MSRLAIDLLGRYPDKAAFMNAFWAGDPLAFQCIDQQLRRVLIQLADKWLYSREEARDVAATALSALFCHREKIESMDHIRRWLFRAVRNSTIDQLYKRRRSRGVTENLLYLATLSEDSTVVSEEHHYRLAKCIMNAMDGLSERKRTILRLYFFEEKNTSQIADMLQLSNQTVLNHKSIALRILRLRIPASLRS